MPAPIDMDSDRPSPDSHGADGYGADFFDGSYERKQNFTCLFFSLLASIADLADLLRSETQDDFIVGLQDTLSDVFSSPTIFALAHVSHRKMRFESCVPW